MLACQHPGQAGPAGPGGCPVCTAGESARQVSAVKLPLPISGSGLLQPVINFLGILISQMTLDNLCLGAGRRWFCL